MQNLQSLLTRSLLLAMVYAGTSTAASDRLPAQQTPLIVPQLLEVVAQKKCLQEDEQEYCAEIRIDWERTGVDWLDQALLAKLAMAETEPAQLPLAAQAQLQLIKQQADAWLVESYAEITQAREAEEPYFIGFDYSDSIRFIAQRNHLASFKQFSYSYSGGAHGMYSTSYALFDLNTHKQLLLADIVQRSADATLLQALREVYLVDYADYAESWLIDDLTEQAQTFLTDNFVFNEQGITFSYAPYVLGPFSEGEVRLTLDYVLLKDILKPEYILDN